MNSPNLLKKTSARSLQQKTIPAEDTSNRSYEADKSYGLECYVESEIRDNPVTMKLAAREVPRSQVLAPPRRSPKHAPPPKDDRRISLVGIGLRFDDSCDVFDCTDLATLEASMDDKTASTTCRDDAPMRAAETS